MSRPNFNRLMGAAALVRSDEFWVDPDAVVRISNALWDGRSPGDSFDPADVAELTWAVLCEYVVEGRSEAPDVSPDVETYVRTRLAYEGVADPPAPLRMAFPGVSGPPPAFASDPAVHAGVAETQAGVRREVEAEVSGRAEAMRKEFSDMGLPDPLSEL